jgi:hypothetical protein
MLYLQFVYQVACRHSRITILHKLVGNEEFSGQNTVDFGDVTGIRHRTFITTFNRSSIGK